MARLLRAGARIAKPWKNGGGVTTDVAVHPPLAGLDDFLWRVSIAEVRSNGPFSRFPGIDRTLAVLDGAMRLAIGDREPVMLAADSDPIVFSGDAPADAVLIGGPLTDLNVMTRRGVFDARVTRHRAPATFRSAGGPILLIARTGLSVSLSGDAFDLRTRDALSIGDEDGEVRVASPEPDFHRVEILRAR